MSDTPSPTPDPADPLALAELFAGGGEPWLPLLRPVIEAQPSAATFIGPGRSPKVVPVWSPVARYSHVPPERYSISAGESSARSQADRSPVVPR